MASSNNASSVPTLERISNLPLHTFSTPTKKINDGDGLTFFLSSTAYRDLMTWLLHLNRSMFPTKDFEGKILPNRLDSPPPYSDTVQNLRSLISDFSALVDKAPPDTGPRRFGNVAFRTWFKLAEENVDVLCERYLKTVLDQLDSVGAEKKVALKEELKVYLLGSFGSAQRLDYGTGHELSFLAFLACLWKVNAFEDGEERAIVVGVIQPYLQLIRRLVLTYTLEPAGSHGVWGLDDHSFVPYIFGSAQYGPAISPNSTEPTPTEGSLRPSPAPSKVADKDVVADYKDSNMYFSAIQFIYDVKRGPFWEHSPVLYDISGIKDGWAKINKGMLKMYAAEVLGKFPVVQHFPFGSLFRWEIDPQAAKAQASVHAQQQPVGARSMDVLPPPSVAGTVGAGTEVPWARTDVPTMPQMQASSGIPSTRAPWAGATSARQPPAGSAMPRTTAPWATTQRPALGSIPAAAPSRVNSATTAMPPPTTAPWTKNH